jgi:hypothetical protein
MVTNEELKQLGFKKYQLLGSKQGWLLVISFHGFQQIREAIIIRGKTLFVIKDYQSIISVFSEKKPEEYFKKLWQCDTLDYSKTTFPDLQFFIEKVKQHYIINSNEYIRTILLQRSQVLIDQANCRHEFVETTYGYECENCRYFTGVNSPVNPLIKRELEAAFLKRQHGTHK